MEDTTHQYAPEATSHMFASLHVPLSCYALNIKCGPEQTDAKKKMVSALYLLCILPVLVKSSQIVFEQTEKLDEQACQADEHCWDFIVV
jgi:hypothetical protein